MSSNKRAGRDISPRDAQEQKKFKQTTGESSSKQKSFALRQSRRSTPDLTSPVKSSVSASGCRPGSPFGRRPSGSSLESPANAAIRPPSPISTPHQMATSPSQACAGPSSAKQLYPSLNEPMSESHQKDTSSRSGTTQDTSSEGCGSVSQPRRGNAPTAPMMGSSAASVLSPTGAAPTTTLSIATRDDTADESLDVTIGPSSLYTVLSETARLTGQSMQQLLAKDRARERLERHTQQAPSEDSATTEAQVVALRRNLDHADANARTAEERLQAQVHALESSMQFEIDKRVSRDNDMGKEKDEALERKVQALDCGLQNLERSLRSSQEKRHARDSRLRGALSPLQTPESDHGILPHDALEELIQRLVKKQLAATLKGPLASVTPLPDHSASDKPAVIEGSPEHTTSNATPGPHSPMTQLKRDLETFTQEMRERDVNRDTKIRKLEGENLQLQDRIVQLENTTREAKQESSSLASSVTDLTRKTKANEQELSAMRDTVKENSKELENVISVAEVATRLQADMNATRDELNCIKKGIHTPTDPRKRSLPLIPSESNPGMDDLERRMDTLERRVSEMPAASEVSNLQETATKLQQAFERLNDHEDDIERYERHLQTDNTRINEINRDIDKIGDTLARLERKVRNIDQDLDYLERDVKQLPHANFGGVGKTDEGSTAREAEVGKLRDVVTRLETENGSLVSQITEISDRKLEERDAALAIPFDKIHKRVDSIEQRLSSLQANVSGIDARLKVSDTEHVRQDDIQKRFDAVGKEQSSLLGRIEVIAAKLENADVGAIRQRAEITDQAQPCLHGRVDDIDVRLKTAEQLRKDSLNRSNEHARSIQQLERILYGDGFTGTELTAPQQTGLIQKLLDMQSAVQSIRRSHRRQSTDDTAQDTLEKRVAQIERDHRSLQTAAKVSRSDIDKIDSELELQSKAIEDYITQQVGDEVKSALAAAPVRPQPTLTAQEIERMVGERTNALRCELLDLCKKEAEQSATSSAKEAEQTISSRLESSIMRMVNEKLEIANARFISVQAHVSPLSDTIARLERAYPPACQETMTDIVTFCNTHGNLSGFLQAISEAIRNLQSRYDNMLTHQLAAHISNQLMPHINERLIPPLRNAIIPVISNESRQSLKQISDRQELLDVSTRELTRRVNSVSTAVLRHELYQELQLLYASVNERSEKDLRLTNEAIQKLRDDTGTATEDIDKDRGIIWEQLLEHRTNIERAQDDFSSIQECVVGIAKEVNKNLVPRDWLDGA